MIRQNNKAKQNETVELSLNFFCAGSKRDAQSDFEHLFLFWRFFRFNRVSKNSLFY